MGKLVLVIIVLLIVVLGGGAAFLMVWTIPAPTAHVERVIPDAHFPR